MTFPPQQPPPYGPDGIRPPPQSYGHYYYPGSQFGPPPDNNMVYGIVATVVFCLPLGVVSLVKSAKVEALWAQGRFDESRRAAASAKTWAIWSGVIFLLFVGTYAAALVYGFATEVSRN